MYTFHNVFALRETAKIRQTFFLFFDDSSDFIYKEFTDMTDLYDSRILIIDDHLQLRRMVTRILAHEGFI